MAKKFEVPPGAKKPATPTPAQWGQLTIGLPVDNPTGLQPPGTFNDPSVTPEIPPEAAEFDYGFDLSFTSPTS